ncbi:MAG: acyl-CoA thioesterase [Clostridiales Family XIII bacterium]|jgi:acyl-CoA thioester hydrolase|nr:acyl-CoA thioesterase [Clostridiales Family XIII bacterium]
MDAIDFKKYHTEVRILYADTDAMGIVWHGNYVRFFELGRTEALREIGFPYTEFEAKGFRMPLYNVTVNFKRPAKFDDVLDIASWPRRLGAAKIVIGYEVTNKTTGELLVTGETTHAIVNEEMKPINIRKAYPGFANRMLILAEYSE